jgi:hypothetical protein
MSFEIFFYSTIIFLFQTKIEPRIVQLQEGGGKLRPGGTVRRETQPERGVLHQDPRRELQGS